MNEQDRKAAVRDTKIAVYSKAVEAMDHLLKCALVRDETACPTCNKLLRDYALLRMAVPIVENAP